MLTWLLVAMALAGVVGGTINYLLAEKPGPNGQRLRKWWQYVIVGLGASFTVPLFLNTISSALVADVIGGELTAQAASKLLVISGFCILAAVSSRAFMQTLASRVLKLAQNADETAKSALATANDAKNDVGTVVESDAGNLPELPHTKFEDIVGAASFIQKANESHGVGEVGPAPFETQTDIETDGENLITDPQAKTLHAIMDSGFVYRTVRGIASTIGVRSSSAAKVLAELESLDMVQSKEQDDSPPKFRITAKGQQALWAHERSKSK